MIKIKKPYKIIILLTVVIAMAVALYFLVIKDDKNNNATIQIGTQEQTEKVDLNPPSEEDKKNTEANKEDIINRDEKLKDQETTTPNTQTRTVKPTITYAGQYGDAIEVGGYINDVFEDDGKCKAIFKKGSTTLTRSVDAIKNNKAVDCPVISAKKTDFDSTGTWEVTLEYTSTTAQGVSDLRTIEIK